MSEEYQVIENKDSVDELVSTYFNFINGRYLEDALKNFAKREGYGQEIVFVYFQSDLDDYDMEQLPKPLDEKHILIELGYPAVETEQIAYLDFETFYEYLEINVRIAMKDNSHDNKLTNLLSEVKKGLQP
ncbi:hypothetical protein HB820_08910 [Listeria booriae]|uniref:hypothetical protein n=1 Tax=Listeria booriae TaxID=1552123 RepID=UPI00162AADA4|nr:hypothetical protein [Listeria booriae]MBC1231371.1 hypothetical protein [Listeria booriae]MBC1335422.1 hypothetical protein [Listeria booriae]